MTVRSRDGTPDVRQVETAEAEVVLECSDPGLGYHAFVAIHSTTRGPALGGIRRWRYPDRSMALEDAVSLARGMSFKSALADLPFGGGKSVIMDAGTTPRTALYRAHAAVIERLDGRYIAAEDMGTTRDDVTGMRPLTRFLAGHTDPAPWTARGVLRGIQAAALHRWRSADLAGCTIALQGCGRIGQQLARELHEAGAFLVVADPDPEAVRRITARFRARAVDPADLLAVEADVLAPCAVGRILDTAAIARLRVAVVAGAANNQLADPAAAELLAGRGILYIPDYLINAGGLMTAGVDLLGWSQAGLERRVDAIYGRTIQVLTAAARREVTPLAVAEETAMAALRSVTRPDASAPAIDSFRTTARPPKSAR